MSISEAPLPRLVVHVGRPPDAEAGCIQSECSPSCSSARISIASPSSLVTTPSWFLGSVESPPSSLMHLHCENRPASLPTGTAELEDYEPIIWLLVYLAFNRELPLTRDLYKSKSPQGIKCLQFPENTAQWRLIAHVMRGFNVHFTPRKYLAWAKASHTAARGKLSRERRCFLRWFAITENNAEGYQWLRIQMGVDPPIDTEPIPEEDITPFCREIVIAFVDRIDEYSDACTLVRCSSTGIVSLKNYLNISMLGTPAFPPQTFQLFGLVEIQARHNAITLLPPAIGNLQSLEVLFLSHNRLQELPPEIGQCGRLHVLVLDHNELERLPEELGKCQHLRTLNCNFNRLQSLPRNLGCCERLEEAYFSDNLIEVIPDTLLDLYHAKRLHFNNNRLREVPRGFLTAWPPGTEVLWRHNRKLGYMQDDGSVLEMPFDEEGKQVR